MPYQILLSQNKILAYFTLDISANTQQLQILQPTMYVCMIYHHHYPVVYFEQLYQHFKHCLPEGTKAGHLRIYLGEKQLPAELPMGLFIKDSTVNLVLRVELSMLLLDAFKIVRNSWKRAFQVINPIKNCYYIKSLASTEDQKQKYRLYREGLPHGLQKQGSYQGSFIVVKGLFSDQIIQRKYSVALYPLMKNVVKDLFCFENQQFLDDPNIRILSFGIPIDFSMTTLTFLNQWSYNDGYCYLILEIEEDKMISKQK